jgi:transcriptional regulator with XRE-family HTH domain
MITRLKLCREAKGLRAYQVASAAGITRTTYSLIEAGHAVPSRRIAIRIATVIGLAVQDLFPGDAHEDRDAVAERS